MADLYIVRLFKEIEQQRGEARLSIDDLALLLGITRKTYIDWRFERRVPHSIRETQFLKLGRVLSELLKSKILPEKTLKLKRLAVSFMAREMLKSD